MKLRELMEGIQIISVKGDLDMDISGVAYDSREVKAGNTFICISGYRVDGHSFIEGAVSKGATAIIVEKDVFVEGVTVIKVADSRRAMPIMAANFYKHPTQNIKLIGLTGTNGKTTTTYLTKSILEESGSQTGLLGTIAIQVGDKVISSSRTTPESLDLQRLFREMLTIGADYGVMEVSSHSLEMGRVDGCDFHIGVFTNLTQDHLDFHKTIESYRDAKKKLFYRTTYANIINADDVHGQYIIEEIKHLKTKLITFGIDNPADIMAKNMVIDAKGVAFMLKTPEYEIEIESSIPGKFSVYNCLAAAAIAYAEGIDKNIIHKGLKKVAAVKGRSEVMKLDKPYTVIIDYAHSPDSLKNILETIKQYAKSRVITMFGCGGDRDNEKRPIMGEIAGQLSDYCIVTTDNPRTEEPARIIRQIEAGISQTQCPYIIIENRREAIKYALSIAQPNDIILLAGKGHETYQELKSGTIHFDEREIVLELLQEEK